MAKTHTLEVLFGDVTPSTVDYKISLDQSDEDAGYADYFAEKISNSNKSAAICATDPNLVYCEVRNHKVVLSPDSSSVDGAYDIIIDSYPILDTTDQEMELARQDNTEAFVFPMQLASGKIRRITIARSQNVGGTVGNMYIGIYANSKPTAVGARLLFDTISTPPKISASGDAFTYDLDNMPEIPGYSEVAGVSVQNTFFYVVFRVELGDTPGFKILVRDSDLSVLHNLASDGIITYGIIRNFDNSLHQTFDYAVDTDEKTFESLRTPYMNITMII